MRIWLFIFCVFLLSSSHSAVLENFSLTSEAQSARLVFDLDEPVEHKIFTLKKPHRLVLDFAKSRLSSGFKVSNVADSIVKNVRYY